MLDLSGIVSDSIVDGPGIRTTVFSQGCPHHCPGCHNPETWDFGCGTSVPVEAIVDIVKSNPLCRGVTFSGGEPFAQAAGFAKLAGLLKEEGYTARMNHVICAEIPDVPGGLGKLLGVIEDAGISVEYMYSFRRNAAGNVLLVLRLSEQEEGCKLLQDAGVIVHTQEEADKY